MDHAAYTDDYIAGILARTRVIAMVGASAVPNRPSYFAMKYLLGKGYRVIPINPSLAGQEILKQPVVGSLQDLEAPVDMVDIFRNSEAALAVTREIKCPDAFGLRIIEIRERLRRAAIQWQAPKICCALPRVHIKQRTAIRRPAQCGQIIDGKIAL